MKECKKQLVKESIRSKFSLKRKFRRLGRNSRRRSRRKRSKLRYYEKLASVRVDRQTNDLCETLEVFDFTGMEWTQVTPSTTEVSEWHKQNQVAYWKSRATSLEYENRMLLEHIRGLYAKQIQDYANYINQEDEEEEEEKSVGERVENANDNSKVAMIEPLEKKRREQMEKLYGSKTAKIMGMETAVQLNYDLHRDDAGKLAKWPHTPLNLKF